MEAILSQYGLAGLVISVLSGVILYQQKKIDKLVNDKNDLQEKRLVEALAAKDKYAEVMSGFSKTSELLLAKLSSGGK